MLAGDKPLTAPAETVEPYVHLDNIESRLLTGLPNPALSSLYNFSMSAEASAAIVILELAVVLGIALLVFRRQEIVY